MKLLYLSFIFSLAMLQPRTGDPIEHTVALLKQDNLPELNKILAPNIDLGILEDENTYPAKQAETILHNFFAKNPPNAVSVVHKINSNPDMQYAIVIISTKNGPYRTSFTLKNNKGVYQLIELSIREEKPN